MTNNHQFSKLGLTALCSMAVVLVVSGFVRAGENSAPSWGFSPANLDTTCEACKDFYQYAMGGWMKANPIPSDHSDWSSFSKLEESNLASLRTILETAAKANAPTGSNQQKIGDFYASCMDTSAIEAAGLKPLASELESIESIQDRKAVDAGIARLQREGINAALAFGSITDFKDSSQKIALAYQAGLGMPDRDYYFRDDEGSKQLRADYVAHIAKMFQLAGEAPDKAVADANRVMELETALAKASRTDVELRDPDRNYNKMTLAELHTLTPNWSWEGFMQAIGAPAVPSIDVGQPEFFKEMNRLLVETPLKDWKVYLKWNLLHNNAPALPESFVQEDFNFYGKKLSGTEEIQPRWKRCVRATDSNLGEALGAVYVDKYFPPAAKARAKEMVNQLISALRSDIPTLSWMQPATKTQALAKLAAINTKIDR